MQANTVYNPCLFQNMSGNLVVQSQSAALAWDRRHTESAENVKMRELPFYNVKEVLLKSQCLIPNVVQIMDAANRNRRLQARYNFGLTVQQAALIADSINFNKATNKIDYNYQIQLRFALLDTKTEQVDDFPPSIFIRVNNKPVTLPPAIQSNYPGVPPRQPSVPLNITDHVKLKPFNLNSSPNTLHFYWMPDIMDRKWVFSLCLVQKLTANDLLQSMLRRGNFKSEVTRQLINSKMTAEADDDMALTSLKVSVTCPLGKSRMTLPCRASTCSHIQCFDALLFLQMTEKKPVWNCPVCHKDLSYENLAVDGFFIDVLNNLSPTAGNDIEIMPDASWRSIDDSKSCSAEDSRQNHVTKSETVADCVMLDDDDGMEIDKSEPSKGASFSSKESQSGGKSVHGSKTEESSSKTVATVSQTVNNMSVELICLDDSDDDDSGPATTATTATSSSSSTTTTSSTNAPNNTNILAALNAPPVSTHISLSSSNNSSQQPKAAPPPLVLKAPVAPRPKTTSTLLMSSNLTTSSTTEAKSSPSTNLRPRTTQPTVQSRSVQSTNPTTTTTSRNVPILPKVSAPSSSMSTKSSSPATSNQSKSTVPLDDDDVICLSD